MPSRRVVRHRVRLGLPHGHGDSERRSSRRSEQCPAWTHCGSPAAELPLALTLIPGILYLVLIRTWPGTIAAGAAFATVTLVLVSSAANDQSSMAGMVVIPLLASSTLAVVTAVLVESIRHPIEWLLPASPSPDCKQAFLIAYDSGTGLVQGAMRGAVREPDHLLLPRARRPRACVLDVRQVLVDDLRPRVPRHQRATLRDARGAPLKATTPAPAPADVARRQRATAPDRRDSDVRDRAQRPGRWDGAPQHVSCSSRHHASRRREPGDGPAHLRSRLHRVAKDQRNGRA